MAEESLSRKIGKTILASAAAGAVTYGVLRLIRWRTGRESKSKSKVSSLVDRRVPETHWEDVGGLDDVKERLWEAVGWPLSDPEYFDRMGVNPPSGVLLYGPPGTGKTLLAKAVATETDSAFIPVKGPELFDPYVGESERMVRHLFDTAREKSPSIIYFDEVDGLAMTRIERSGGARTDRTVVSQLLTEISGLEELRDVAVIGSTNRIDLVDPALLRSGRFDLQLEVPAPDVEDREEIFEIHTRDVQLAKDVDLSELAEKTDGFTGADIELACREAALAAMRSKEEEVGMDHFLEALEKIREKTST